ncbi:DNA/RNA endonuclease G [Microbacterium sp. BDGP8]|uniref:DNA/RNA endonuclease G n=1 Tax=Microbacterium sp. BDGP8 TaxID=3035531 RepID=UPI00249E6519|nr:DNA/RNA endonuclease G [Microbacterium sp. BDGP8]WHE36656.1 DNA/RNA endonuclease G [Microbacterium sp. BDGP8]
MSSPVLRRVVRRETHSPRTVAMIVAVVLVILALIYVGTEIVLNLAGQPALLLGPAAAFGWVVGLPTEVPVGVSVAIGAVIAVLGVVLVVLAVAPGRLSKHQLVVGESAVVADNGVIASAIAQRVSDESGLPRDQVRVGVGHRSVDVTLTPAVGVPVDETQVRAIADAELGSYRLASKLRTAVRIERPREQEENA